jgi:hypothetical protein
VEHALTTGLSILAIVALIGACSALGTRLLTRKGGAFWVWNHSTAIGWALVVVGAGLVLAGLLVLPPGSGKSSLLALGSLLLIGGLWLIWV